MKKIVNFGSINIDNVYTLPHIVREGETLRSTNFKKYLGGKGCNQSIALAKAGALVYHAGNISRKDKWIKDKLKEFEINTDFINLVEIDTGHAIVQVSTNGNNAIIINSGANFSVTPKQIKNTISHFNPGDYILLQNEINLIPDIIDIAFENGLKIIFNPAPMNESIKNYPLKKVDLIILNEIEGQTLTEKTKPIEIINQLKNDFQYVDLLLTLGGKGAIFSGLYGIVDISAEKVEVIDSTGAGDTFIGYFLREWINDVPIDTCLKKATKAAAISVTRKGSSDSIPFKYELVS